MLGGVLAVLALAGGAAYAGYRSMVARRPIPVDVRSGGAVAQVRVPRHATVATALAKAGTAIHDGRLLAVGDRRVLDAHLHPGSVSVDGHRADPAARLRPHDRIVVVDGQDAVEGTRTVARILAPASMPAVLRHVQVAGRAGREKLVVGVRSGEVVTRQVVITPVPPHQVRAKVVALTFDDGPSPTWTLPILAVLKAKQVHATFCEIGQEVQAHPELSQAVVAGGNQLCNHTLNHDEHLDREGPARLAQQITGGRGVFIAHHLPRPAYYRPPGGSLSAPIEALARADGEQVLFWKVDTEDWKRGATPQSILAKIDAEVDNGAIILMHDGGGDRSATVAALGMAIDQLRAAGYTFVFPIYAPPAH